MIKAIDHIGIMTNDLNKSVKFYTDVLEFSIIMKFELAEAGLSGASDGWPDRKNLSLFKDILRMLISRPKIEGADIRPFAGNYVIIKCGSAFSFLAHMRQGSLTVTSGQRVECGQKIGEVGNSGFSLAPHLHFQMMGENTSLDNLLDV